MTMTAAGMASAIKAAIIASGATITEPAQLDSFCTALGNGIVPYITANATATIPPAAIATQGTATAQSGPPAPVLLSIT